MDGNDLAAIVGRSTAYVSRHLNGRADWALGDIERMATAWGLTPEALACTDGEGAEVVNPSLLERWLLDALDGGFGDRLADRVAERLSADDAPSS